jgi:trehalose synthase-fused probable maltokinase
MTDARTWLKRFAVAEPMGPDAIASALEMAAAEYWLAALAEMRWFGEKGRAISSVVSRTAFVTERGGNWLSLSFLDVAFERGPASTWFVPMIFEQKPTRPGLFVITDGSNRKWFGTDAAGHHVFQEWLRDSAAASALVHGGEGVRFSWNGTSTDALRVTTTGSRLVSGEQSNSSIVYGDAFVIKVMRRIVPGLNPDVELGRYLATADGASSVPKLLADWTLEQAGTTCSLAVAQTFVPHAVDGWSWLLAELKQAGNNPARQADIIEAIEQLGVVTAELHQSLAAATEPAIAPEPISAEDLTGWSRATLQLMDTVGDALAQMATGVSDPQRLQLFEAALTAWPMIGAGVIGHEASSGLMKIRVHGDFHLGQTLMQSGRWHLIDFEGEPARSIDERRARFSPLKDVAGMLRSIDYAKAMIVMEPRGWLDESNALNDAFVSGYRSAITMPGLVPESEAAFQDALKPWIVDKAMYEILYELNNRPDWLIVPIAALLRHTFMDRMDDYVARSTDAEP